MSVAIHPIAAPWGRFALYSFLIDGPELALVDTGVTASAAGVPAELERLGRRIEDVRWILLTHGHLDHMWSVLPVCGAHDVPAFVHADDRGRLADPVAGLPPDWVGSLGLAGVTFAEPDDVREICDGELLDLAGLDLVVRHAPGHTAGSVVFCAAAGGSDGEPMMFAGDLLFAGSVGRTDLPGGDDAAMRASLARVVLGAPDETVVLPGHGARTTIGRERATNPYLQGLGREAGRPADEGVTR